MPDTPREVKGRGPDEGSLQRYLEAKFFSQLIPAVAREVFKRLWHLVFAGIDERCKKNRSINYLALRFLYERSAEDFLRLVDAERKRFSKVAVENEILKLLVEFLSVRPRIFDLLTDEARGPLQDFVMRSPEGLLGWFVLPGGIEAQLKRLVADEDSAWARCSEATFRKWVAVLAQFGLKTAAAPLAVRAYIRSASFDQADHRYSLLSAVLESPTAEQLLECLRGVEGNGQTSSRGRARIDHRELKAVCDEVLGATFDYSPYPAFMRRISQ